MVARLYRECDLLYVGALEAGCGLAHHQSKSSIAVPHCFGSTVSRAGNCGVASIYSTGLVLYGQLYSCNFQKNIYLIVTEGN